MNSFIFKHTLNYTHVSNTFLIYEIFHALHFDYILSPPPTTIVITTPVYSFKLCYLSLSKE